MRAASTHAGTPPLPAVARHLSDKRDVALEQVYLRCLRRDRFGKPLELRVRSFGDVMIAVVSEWSADSFGLDVEMLSRRSRDRRVQCLCVFTHYLLLDYEATPEGRRATRR